MATAGNGTQRIGQCQAIQHRVARAPRKVSSDHSEAIRRRKRAHSERCGVEGRFDGAGRKIFRPFERHGDKEDGPMNFLPKSRTARRRLAFLATGALILTAVVGLTLYGLSGSISYFYTPSQALKAHVPAGRTIELGGLVVRGSLAKPSSAEIDFLIRDRSSDARVTYRGDLPDLFREGQGVVASGAFNASGVFVATQILAKHDERYMPRQLARALKARGEWRGDGGQAEPPLTSYGPK